MTAKRKSGATKNRKKIMICFDGTCNHPSDAQQEREWFGLGDIEDNGITNILKLHVMFGGDLANTQGKVKGQHSFYYSGVGTYGNKVQKIFNAGFAPDNLDVRRIIKTAGSDLKDNYKKGDEIYIFGFSRGAAIARRFAAVVRKYIDIPKGATPIRFLGVFDTVASIGFPNLNDGDKPQSDVVFENNRVSPHIQQALHLVSLDERRKAFMPTLMNHEGRVEEIWFPGAHADIGGGFWFDGLSDVSLKFMLDRLDEIGIRTLNVDKIDYGKLKAKDGSYQIDKEDVQMRPNYRGKSHQQDRFAPVAAMTLESRDVRVNVDDEPSSKHVPRIHQSVGRRIVRLINYRPKALKGREHDVVDDGGQVTKREMQGVYDHLEALDPVA